MVKILNFGSLNLDYVYDVEHFVRAGETISSSGMAAFCGGKGLNQSVALARAGARVFHAGAIGIDGGLLTDMLAQNGVDVSLVQTTDAPSGHAIIQREPNGQNCILLFSGSNRRITDVQIENALSGFSRGDYLVLQNEINSVPAIMRMAKEKGMHIVLNPSPMDEKILDMPLDMVDIFVLNEVEAEELCGGPGNLMRRLRERFPSAAIALTLGKEGALYQDPSMQEPVRHGIYRVPVVDTTAAGDTFTGFLVSCVSEGKSVSQAMEIASKAASLAVSRMGAAPSIPTMDEVLAAKLSVLR